MRLKLSWDFFFCTLSHWEPGTSKLLTRVQNDRAARCFWYGEIPILVIQSILLKWISDYRIIAPKMFCRTKPNDKTKYIYIFFYFRFFFLRKPEESYSPHIIISSLCLSKRRPLFSVCIISFVWGWLSEPTVAQLVRLKYVHPLTSINASYN